MPLCLAMSDVSKQWAGTETRPYNKGVHLRKENRAYKAPLQEMIRLYSPCPKKVDILLGWRYNLSVRDY